MEWNLPNTLTWTRIAAIPLIILLFYMPYPWADPAAGLLFAAAGVTDSLDGYFARRFGQSSRLGAFLDPVADKLMVTAALLMLVQLTRIDAAIALVIVGREIAISALREWMAQIGASKSVAVNSLGKFKTACQMVAIPMLLYYGPLSAGGVTIDTRVWGVWLIYLAAVLTIWSMLYYMKLAWPQIRERSGA